MNPDVFGLLKARTLWLALLLLGSPVSFALIFLLQVFVLQAASHVERSMHFCLRPASTRSAGAASASSRQANRSFR